MLTSISNRDRKLTHHQVPQYKQFASPATSPSYPPPPTQPAPSSNVYAAPVEREMYASPRQANFGEPPMTPGYATAPSPAPSSTLNSNRPDSMSGGVPSASHFTSQHNV